VVCSPDRAPRLGTVGGLLLSMSAWFVIATEVGRPARAAVVLAFLTGGPALLAGRLARRFGALEAAAVGMACAAGASGIVAGMMIAAGDGRRSNGF
jgi:hypothetical protein